MKLAAATASVAIGLGALAAGRATAAPACIDKRTKTTQARTDVTNGQPSFCVDHPTQCFVYDGSAWRAGKPTASAAPQPKITMTTAIHTCAADGTHCHDLVTHAVPANGIGVPDTEVSADHAYVALVRARDFVVFDLANNAVLAKIPAWNDSVNHAVAFSGDRIAIVLWNADATSRIFDVATGAQVADVGAVTAVAPVGLGGGAFAFVTSQGAAIDVRDRRGTSVHRVALTPHSFANRLDLSPDGKVLYASDALGMPAAIDTATWAMTPLTPPPSCP